ncbi:MAG: hypothetical protein RIR11_2951 [Bacteroidota bacterium]|jgi:hypothetical protein
MEIDLGKLVDDHIKESSRRGLVSDTNGIIMDTPEAIVDLIELLSQKDVEFEWKRNQVKAFFLSFLVRLEEDTYLRVTYELVRRCLDHVDIDELADKLCFFVSGDKLLDQILQTKDEQRLKQFNRLLINELLLRGRVISDDKKKIFLESFSEFDFNWVGLELNEIETGLSLRNYTLNGSGFGFSFGLQSEKKFPYSVLDFSDIKLSKNTNQELNNLSSTIAKDHIHLIEMGSFEYSAKDIDGLPAGIICHLSYNEYLSEITNIAFKQINIKDLFHYLFSMSVFGGAYGRGGSGATSRINSWKVISGLIQKNYLEFSKEEIVEALNHFTWAEFSTEQGWFINEWIDLGVIGINIKEKKYAILVISDTD